jgi:hypothetical protein
MNDDSKEKILIFNTASQAPISNVLKKIWKPGGDPDAPWWLTTTAPATHVTCNL